MAVATQTLPTAGKESFAALLDESLGATSGLEGTVIKGTVIAVENDAVLIDVGLKSEGRVPLKEFAAPGDASQPAPQPLLQILTEDLIGRPAMGRLRLADDEDSAALAHVGTRGAGTVLHHEPLLRRND